jgi:hypothetical protein
VRGNRIHAFRSSAAAPTRVQSHLEPSARHGEILHGGRHLLCQFPRRLLPPRGQLRGIRETRGVGLVFQLAQRYSITALAQLAEPCP